MSNVTISDKSAAAYVARRAAALSMSHNATESEVDFAETLERAGALVTGFAVRFRYELLGGGAIGLLLASGLMVMGF